MEVKRSGGNAVAKCPFHPDSSPSLYIYQNNYHCFACKAHGTVIDYEMHRTGAAFREAIESLSQTYQIPLEYDTSNEERQNYAKNDYFEGQNKDLEKMHLFFKENLDLFIQNQIQMISNEFKDFLINKLKKQIDFVYTGNNSTYLKFIESISLRDNIKVDLSERIAFPLYKESGKLCGFAYSKKILDWQNLSLFSENDFLLYLNHLEVFTPFPKSALYCLNWQQARNQVANQKYIVVTSNFYDLFSLLSAGKKNTITCLQIKIDIPLAKVFTKKVPRVIIAVSEQVNQNAFLWKTFLETIVLGDITFDTVFCSIHPDKNSLEDINKIFLNTKPLWDEILNKFFDSVPASIKLDEFRKTLLPIFNKIDDNTRKELLLDNIATKYFGSSKKIFFNQNYPMYKLKNSDKNNSVNTLSLKTKYETSPEIKEPAKVEIPISEDKSEKFYEIEKEFIAKSVYFYHKILLSELPVAKAARLYLEERGIYLEHILKWSFGFCPSSNELAKKVEKNLVPAAPLLELGLIKKSKINDGYYDFFHDRIIIPIHGHDGMIIALSGRIFNPFIQQKMKELPKYINSSESAIFAKSNVLYNFYSALQSIVSYGFVVVVEGYMDCISLVNAGVTNTVAVMGTSITHAHMEALSKVTKRIILCFDSDKAGQNAARRTFFIAYPFQGIDLEYLEIPDGKDPDDFIKKYGVNDFRSLIPKTVPLLTQVCQWIFEESSFKPELFLRQVKEHLLPIILQHPDKQAQEEALVFLCDKYFENVYPSDLRSEMESLTSLHIKSHFVKEVSKSEAFSLEEWPAFSVTEVKLILSLVHSRFYELPIRLRNVAQGLSSSEEANERICALAISNQMSKTSFTVYLELLSAMVENQHVSLIELEDLDKYSFSHQAKVVLAYANSDVHILFQYKMEELLKESLPVGVSMISFKNIWDLKNSGFLRFQLRNIKLSSQRGVLSAFTAEALLHLELEYIDNALKAFSSFHFDNEIDKQFHDLVRERTRRSKEFGSFESFNLQ